MDQLIVDIVERLGLLGIFVLMVLENVFPPMPSEAIMGAAGLAIHNGRMDVWSVLAVGTLGTLVGNWFWFWIGRRLGCKRLGPFVARWGRWLTLEWEDVERASRFFRHHGHWVVFVTRMLPVMRTMISLPAGLAHMGFLRFSVFTTAGALGWNAILVFGTQWLARTFAGADSVISIILIAIVVLSIAAYLWRVLTWKPRSRR